VWVVWFGIALTAAAAAYSLTAAIAVNVRLKAAIAACPVEFPAVTILKPLCGAEHELFECLHSFFDQDYPRFQIVFGVSDGDDPATKVVARLRRAFPHFDAKLVVDRRQHGRSAKVSNLMNMLPLARHEYLIMSDSDVRVSRDYLSRIVPPLLDPVLIGARRAAGCGPYWGRNSLTIGLSRPCA
jgi:ceramide glucosyltransferase